LKEKELFVEAYKTPDSLLRIYFKLILIICWYWSWRSGWWWI